MLPNQQQPIVVIIMLITIVVSQLATTPTTTTIIPVTQRAVVRARVMATAKKISQKVGGIRSHLGEPLLVPHVAKVSRKNSI